MVLVDRRIDERLGFMHLSLVLLCLLMIDVQVVLQHCVILHTVILHSGVQVNGNGRVMVILLMEVQM